VTFLGVSLTGPRGVFNIALIVVTVSFVAWPSIRSRIRRRTAESAPPPRPQRVSEPPVRISRVPGLPVDGEPLTEVELWRLEEIDADPDNDIPALAYDSTGEA